MTRRMTHFGPYDPSEGNRAWQKTLRAWLSEGRAEGRDVAPDRWTLRAAAGRYIQHRAAIGCSPHRAGGECYRLNAWIRWAEGQGLNRACDVDQRLLVSFLTRCQLAGYAANTLVGYRQLLSGFTRFLLNQGVLHDDPMLGLRVGRPIPTGAHRVLTSAELNDLVAALTRRAAGSDPRWGWHHRRDLLMCKVLIATGIRVSELCGLRWRDFDPSAGTLMVEGKGSGPFAIQARRVFVCDPHLLRELQAWQEGQGDPDRALFPPFQRAPLDRGLTPGGVDRLVKDWATVAGLGRPLHAHVFRHTFCSHLIANGADVYSVQQLMGHRRVEVTLDVYLYLTEGEVRGQWQQYTPLASTGQ
jgi:site-specific recombinase XerD